MLFLFSRLNKKIYELLTGGKPTEEAKAFIGNLERAFFGYAIAGFCVFVFEITAGRILGPEIYGKYVLVSSVGLFLYLFMTLGVNAAMVKYGAGADDDIRKKIISSGYFIAVCASLFFSFVFFVFSAKISTLLSLPKPVFLAAILLGILFGFYVIATDSLRAIYNIKNLSFFRASYGILILLLFFIFFNFVSHTSFFIAIFPVCISYFIIAVAITFSIKKYLIFRPDKFWIKKLFNYGFFAALGGLMLTFLATQSQLFINLYSPGKNVGIYAAYYFSSINITVFLYNIFIVVFFPAVSKLTQKQAAFKKIGKLIPFLFLIWLPLLFLIQIVSLKIYGPQYPLNIPLILAFDLSAILICIYGLYSWFFYSLDVLWVKKITVLTVFIFPTNILLNLFLVPMFSLWGAIFSTLLTYVISLFSLFVISKKERKGFTSLDNFSPIKICHVASADMTVRFILLNHLLDLKNQGYDVLVVCSSGKWVKDIQNHGIKVKTIEIKRKIFTPISDFTAFIKMAIYFRNEKVNIVHTHTPKAGILGRFAAKAAGVPVIVHTNHGFYFQKNTPPVRRIFFIFLEKMAARCCDLIFSINKEDIETAVAEGICRREHIKYSGDGISVSRFNPSHFSEEFISAEKRRFGINEQDKVVGFVGRLVEEKGVRDLMLASFIIRKDFPGTTFLIVGPKEPDREDHFDPELHGKDYNLDEKILFLGEIADAPRLYSLMDIFVLPSHREGLGLVLLEASAMEKPVIGTDIRGCREAVEDGKTGLLVPVKNPEKLAEAIVYLLKNPEKDVNFGKTGRVKIIREFDERMVFNRIEKEYERLIKEKL